MSLFTFDPRETERFQYCCGGYRRWELVEDHQEWWWSLASDWGQAHVADLLIPVSARIDVRMDVSRVGPEVSPGSATLAFCSRIRVGRLGVDGLPYRADVHLNVALERGRLRMGGDDLSEPGVWPLAASYWEEGPVSVTIEKRPNEVITFINGDEVARGTLHASSPGLLLLTGSSAGAREAGTRFGNLKIERLGARI